MVCNVPFYWFGGQVVFTLSWLIDGCLESSLLLGYLVVGGGWGGDSVAALHHSALASH